jgi:hypothetical protein
MVMRPKVGIFLAAFAALASLVCADSSLAQAPDRGCTIEQIGGTSRHRLRCSGGLSAIAESGARFTLLDRDRNGDVDAVRHRSRALLLEYQGGQATTPIEVIAPQAIAAVRGTTWAVDVQASRTSVFVVDGSVAVRRRTGGDSVTLNAGDGVDVEAGAGPLEVKRWSRARVSALLARFGQ